MAKRRLDLRSEMLKTLRTSLGWLRTDQKDTKLVKESWSEPV